MFLALVCSSSFFSVSRVVDMVQFPNIQEAPTFKKDSTINRLTLVLYAISTEGLENKLKGKTIFTKDHCLGKGFYPCKDTQ